MAFVTVSLRSFTTEMDLYLAYGVSGLVCECALILALPDHADHLALIMLANENVGAARAA